MKKLAIFVEGQTEQVFVHRLINEIAGRKNLTVRLDQLQGGAKSERTISKVEVYDSEENVEYFVLVRDSATDSRVLSDVQESLEKLKENGFEKVIGLRDLYPLPIDKLPRVEQAISRVLSEPVLPAKIVVAVREIETWFLSETAHFGNIDEKLTLELIKEKLSLDFQNLNFEDIEHPSDTLHEIYQLVGKAYKKSKRHVDRTVDALDYENVYLVLQGTLASLGLLVSEIDSFLTKP
ncbi:TPA: DUF4276 family protein [Vibrio harveyi]|uniref:DUF4276 family protein n=1 Tax=Vibrio harveyi TaxID=669 RepID=UPI002FE7BA38|nr:DUF4276 family protein [Vibrio harveyi]